MDSQHRKIELQAPADLSYLTAQLRTAARQKLDLHLPSTGSEGEPDELRTNVEALVDAFVAQILAGMRSNISINGLDVVPALGEDGSREGGTKVEGAEQEEYEPFDDKLRGRLGTTVAKRDALIAKISQYRRTVPASSTQAFEQQWIQAQETEDANYQALLGKAVVVEDESILGVEGLERHAEVERNWERAVQGLERLNKGLPETRARLERCGNVVGYLGGEDKTR